MKVQRLDELAQALEDIDREEPYPANAHLVRRGKRSGTQKVVLPHGFLDDPDDPTPPCAEAESEISGG